MGLLNSSRSSAARVSEKQGWMRERREKTGRRGERKGERERRWREKREEQELKAPEAGGQRQ